MPRRAQKKRAQRRQRQMENQFNDGGIMDHRGGTFRVRDQLTKQYTRGLSWEQAVKLWNTLEKAIILDDN